MKIPVVIVAGYLLVGLELGIRDAIELGQSSVAPSFVIPFLVFIALFAPTLHALWTAAIIGIVIDLAATPAVEPGMPELTLIGPHVIGYCAMAYFVLQLRGLVMRRNPLVLIILSVLGAMLASLVIVALISIRASYSDPTPWAALDELLTRFAGALYTGITGTVAALVFLPLMGIFGFQDSGRSPFRRNS